MLYGKFFILTKEGIAQCRNYFLPKKKHMIIYIKRLLTCMNFSIKTMVRLKVKYNHQSPYKKIISK